MWNTSPGPGRRLREVRESLGLTLRDVARQSARTAVEHGDSRFKLSATTLFCIETKGQVPTLHRLHSLTCAYGLELPQVLAWYLEDETRTDYNLDPCRVSSCPISLNRN